MGLYPDLFSKFHDSASEERISLFWKKHNTFSRSIEQREGCPDWVFYEGPPTANGMPGVHHVMARLCKDIMCRFKTMTGHRVVRKAGWDTHGLPVERAVEKGLNIQGAQAIEDFGLAPFNDKCRESVWTCKTDWDEFTRRLGYWVDLEDPYITYDNNYIETVWWILSQFHEKGMLYKGHKVVPYCPVCATPLSTNEIASSYRKVNEASIYVKLKATDADEFFVTWTTTPWTLPSNVALAIGKDFDYVRVRHGGEVLILAEARLGVLDPEVATEVLETMKGADLIGRHYEQLLPFVSPGVMPGQERLRCNVTAAHTRAQMGYTLEALAKIGKMLDVLPAEASTRYNNMERALWVAEHKLRGVRSGGMKYVRSELGKAVDWTRAHLPFGGDTPSDIAEHTD